MSADHTVSISAAKRSCTRTTPLPAAVPRVPRSRAPALASPVISYPFIASRSRTAYRWCSHSSSRITCRHEQGASRPGAMRVLARCGRERRCGCGQEVAHHRDAARPRLEHLGVTTELRSRRLSYPGRLPRCRCPEGRWGGTAAHLQDRTAQPHVRGQDQMPQRLASHHSPSTTTARASSRRVRAWRPRRVRARPRPRAGRPGLHAPLARPGKCRLSSASTNGITSTPFMKLSPSESDGAVSTSAPSTRTPRITTSDRSDSMNRAPRRSAPMNSAPQIFGPGEGRHDFSLSSALWGAACEAGVRVVPDRMDDLVGSLQLRGVAGVGQ